MAEENGSDWISETVSGNLFQIEQYTPGFQKASKVLISLNPHKWKTPNVSPFSYSSQHLNTAFILLCSYSVVLHVTIMVTFPKMFIFLLFFFFLIEVMPSLVARLVKNPPAMQETLIRFLGRKILCRRDRLPSPLFSGFSSGSSGKESTCNARNLNSFLGWKDPLEKGTATNSSILVWRIPWTV